MTKAELLKAEKVIRAGLDEARAHIDREVALLKPEAPGVPEGSIRQSITRGITDDVAAALFLIKRRREREEAA